VPTYTYRCSTCELVFEATQSIKDDALTQCNCGKAQPVQKVFTPVGVTFKGSGFYKTDARSGTASTPPAASATTDSSSSSSSESSSSTTEKAPKPDKAASDSTPKADKPAKKEKTAPAATATPKAST
jgi:putative FmdB family regulatory protein